MAAPAIQTHATTVTDAVGTTLTINKPASTVSGDLLVVLYYVNGGPAITKPTGWTNITSIVDSFAAGKAYADYLVAGGSEPASYSWTWTGNQYSIGAILRITGQHASAFLDASNTAAPGSGTTQTSPSVTTSTADCLILRSLGCNRIGAAPFTPPGSHTEDYDFAGTAAFDATAATLAWINQATAGASGTADFTMSTAYVTGLITVAIAPAAGGTAPTLAQLMRGTGRSMTRGFNKRAG